MTTNDKNKLAFEYANALQTYKDAQINEAAEDYPLELTLERVEADGFLQGLEAGAMAGYRHAIALLNADLMTEQAQTLQDHLTTLEAIFEAGE